MIETEKQQERVILIGVELQGIENFSMSMEELASLAKTAGAQVVSSYTQKREKYDSKIFVGAGKLEEIKRMVEADEISTVIVNNRLTPRQNINLEEILGIKVIDRMQLILDIFAMRARSHEGKLQVHLAQLKYLLPRLVGQGIMLSRQAGGIGSRGPGESQLELNRRSVRNQIHDIERQLKIVEKNRATVREKRLDSSVFKIGLIGYTNAGKSTIMNVLTNKNQYEADELFATLDATTKSVNLIGRLNVTLTDTVGFIQDLPTELVSSFKSTLEESKNVDLLVHVIDASDPNHEEHEKTVLAIMKDLDMLDIPRLTLYNKADKAENFTPTLTPYVLISAKKENSRAVLQEALLNKMRELFVPFWIKVSPSKAYKLHELESLSIIDKREYLEESETLSGYIAEKNKWRLEEFYD
ncbi:GTPase HflX [Streptococcus anginosus]|uniref:GTPase HflX n=1 Tax=Streptococcus anginosus TaxID=1328 RepID=A0ABD4U4L7_STRAP|nr:MULTISPECIES: GTPase HflX [Streptococcus]KAA9295949.1 GTPase HflX [Streptococcus anginosus]KUM00966.1 GTPase HflX [Streptococcus anginosus]MCW1076960.1 GTPase HflX [Streptococcus anginosus]MDB8656111.1 GTPase HflX [Streptococcus anginosus]MDB8659580.1 GTPase HflX [Streptococcus anginosus]